MQMIAVKQRPLFNWLSRLIEKLVKAMMLAGGMGMLPMLSYAAVVESQREEDVTLDDSYS
ncbi:hypothetical protein [Candidatus Pantoea rara]|uniref:hypothetical protein n=1 Tax=Candidatus Pantoea rara TaxID=1947037 RepID=UPI003EBAF0B2